MHRRRSTLRAANLLSAIESFATPLDKLHWALENSLALFSRRIVLGKAHGIENFLSQFEGEHLDFHGQRSWSDPENREAENRALRQTLVDSISGTMTDILRN